VQAQDYNIEDGISIFTITDSEPGAEFIGQIADGDFTQYKIDVSQAGTYNVVFRVASNEVGGTITLYNRDDVLGSVNVSNTGGWRTFTTVSTTVDLEEGVQSLRLEYNGSGNLFNINWLEFQPMTLSTNSEFLAKNIRVYPNPASDQLFVSGLQTSKEFEIIDLTGRVISSAVLKEQVKNAIDISNLSQGLYLLSQKGSGFSHKFIKN